MYKLNNKGFAFSTILYGLMLMGIMIIIVIMSLMQTNRITNKNFVDNIEKELNRFSLTETVFDSNGSQTGQEFIVPMGQSGWYKIELWGAQGGNHGGLGAYTSGLIWLKENAHLYFYVGKQGNTFNGAGNGSSSKGGGATDVRLEGGNWDFNLDKRIMVAAGGGGGSQGGDGGTILGYKGKGTGAGAGASQKSQEYAASVNGSGASSSGGGGGYNNGKGSTGSGGAGGGSSYISGYAGVSSISRSNGNLTKYYITAEESNYTMGYFINGVMLPGVKSGDGSARITKVLDTTNVYNPGIVPEKLNSRLNSVRYIKDCINGIRKSNTNTINNNYWSELQVIENGVNIAYGKPFVYTSAGGNYSGSAITNSSLVNGVIPINKDSSTGVSENNNNDRCVVVDLGGIHDVSEIAVWHDYVTGEQNAINHRLYVSNNNYNWVELANSVNNSLESYDTSNGFHYSAWQTNSMDILQDGTYYIMNAGFDNVFLTAKESETIMDPTSFYNKFTGSATQQWNIKSIGENKYLITSVAGGYPLQVKNGTFYDGSEICTKNTLGLYSWEQWYISSVGKDASLHNVYAGNNTYYIYANVVINPVAPDGTFLPQESGNIYLSYSNNGSYNFPSNVVGKKFVASGTTVTDSINNRFMRFRLIPVTY